MDASFIVRHRFYSCFPFQNSSCQVWSGFDDVFVAFHTDLMIEMGVAMDVTMGLIGQEMIEDEAEKTGNALFSVLLVNILE